MEAWKTLLLVLLALVLAGGLFMLYAGWAFFQALSNEGSAYIAQANKDRAERVKRDREWARKNPNPQKVRVWGGALV